MNEQKSYQPQSREDYLAKCRYYDGNDDLFAYGEYSQQANYEQVWVDYHFNGEIDELNRMVEGYKCFGLGDFNTDDGVPIGLKAILWSRFMHWGSGYEAADDFKKWYKTFYLKQPE